MVPFAVPAVSVIVPIYKVEPYIHRCIDSILAQTFTDFELILIDDGSPDNCGRICDHYTTMDIRVRTVHKENGGLSDSRNVGVSIATGEFIMFVDGDDCIHPQMIETLMDGMALHKADVASCNICYFDDVPQYLSVKGKFRVANIWKEMSSKPEFSVCNRLFRKKLFGGVNFPVGCLFEDQFVIFKLLGAGKVVCTDDPLYFYYQRTDGLSKQRFYPENYDLLNASLEMLRAIPVEQTYCRRVYTEIAVKRIGLLLGNSYYHDGQFENCKIDKVIQWTREHLSELTSGASVKNIWKLHQVSKGSGILLLMLIKTYFNPVKVIGMKIKSILKFH